MGISAWATKGAGKSRALGRLIAWQDFYRGIPLVMFDPIGAAIDHVLDKLLQLPPAERLAAEERVRYVRVAGQDGLVVPFPILYSAAENERFSDIAQRYPAVLERLDPALRSTSVQGMNALAPLAQAAGIVLAALGLGISEAWSLIHDPAWEPRLVQLAAAVPETAPAVATLRALYRMPRSEQTSRLIALESKLSLFQLHPNFRAIFGATTPGINWQEVVDQGQAVLLDFHGITDTQTRRFCLLWIYNTLRTFILQRGYDTEHPPLSLVIDELPDLVGSEQTSTDVLTADLGELINRIARSHRVWLTIAGQDLSQLPSQLREVALSTGVVLLGRIADHRIAKDLAERYFPFDPHWSYKTEPVYGVIADAVPGGFRQPTEPARHGIVDFRTHEIKREDQIALRSREFLTLARYEFLLGLTHQEGELPTELIPITIEELDQDQYPDVSTLRKYRAQLMRRHGVSEQALLAQIDARAPVSRAAPQAPPAQETAPASPQAARASPPAATIGRRPRW